MSKTKQIIGLDGLRFLAALMVLFFHLGFWNWSRVESYRGTFPDAYLHLAPAAWFGWVGVEVFFVLSGFVIAYSAQRATALVFFQHRLTRLLPAAVICASVSAIVFLALKKELTHKAIALLWLKSVTFPFGPWIDNSYWTLETEISFYAVILILLALKRFDLVSTVIACIGGVSTVFWIIASFPSRSHVCILFRPLIMALVTHVAPNMLLIRHGCYFAVGVYLWLCLYSEKGWTPGRVAIIAINMIGGVLQIIFRARDLGALADYSMPSVVPVAIWLGSVAFIVVAVLKNEKVHSLLGTRGSFILRRLGLMTYPLYLIHEGVALQLIHLFNHSLSAMTSWLLSVSIVILVAYLISAYAEPVLQGILKRSFTRSPIETTRPTTAA